MCVCRVMQWALSTGNFIVTQKSNLTLAGAVAFLMSFVSFGLWFSRDKRGGGLF